jgi:NhaA family Na+:H+ antiporter
MPRKLTLDFLDTEALAGAALVFAAGLALLAANTPASGLYLALLHLPAPLQIGPWRHVADLQTWVREGLMAVFFLVVGLELKYEALRGELSEPGRIFLPVIAAIGGMALPALIYLAVNLAPGGRAEGWPVPTATDVAFAVAALAAAGRDLPASLRLFLLTLAMADDLGALAIIALVYSHNLALVPLSAAAGVLVGLAGLAVATRNARPPAAIWLVGFLLVWGLVLEAGVNTSLAGFLTALTVPIGDRGPGRAGVLKRIMHALHPWVAFLILPLFAFTAAGLDFTPLVRPGALTPVAVGVALALLVGKPVGVLSAARIAERLGLGAKPDGARWREVAGVAVLCGIGFTMSLFLDGLAFAHDAAAADQARLGVLTGSLGCTVIGAVMLRGAARRRLSQPIAAPSR